MAITIRLKTIYPQNITKNIFTPFLVIFFNIPLYELITISILGNYIISKKTAPKNKEDKNINLANSGWLRILLVPTKNNKANIININSVNAT